MRKFKRIVPFVAAVCLVFSLCFSLACKTTEPEDQLQSLTLDTSNAKVDYSIGEEYSSTGLQVTASYSSGQTEAVSLENVTINSSAYDAYNVGSYDIIVSYTSGGTTAEASYKVTVADAKFGGLMVKLKADRSDTLNLSKDKTTEDFTDAADWIEVRTPDAIGEVDENSAPLSKDSYTVKVYRNGDEVTELGAVKRGVYQIVASMYDDKADFTYEGFALVVVFDDVENIAFKEGKTSQEKGLKETMTRTWKFTVTFNSGDTEVVDKTSSYLTLTQINPNIAAAGGTARATYLEPKLLSAPATTARWVDVPYSLEGDQSHPDLAILNFGDTDAFNSADLTAGNFGTIVYKNGGVDFEIVGGPKGKIADNRAAEFDLPIGISLGNGDTSCYCGQAFQSNSASSEEGMFINFTLKKNCEVYIYARSNGVDNRCMFLETEDDYAIVTGVEGYLGINGVPTISSDYNKEGKCSTHAASITGLSSENPAQFKLTFDASINVFYILIIFPEEANNEKV